MMEYARGASKYVVRLDPGEEFVKSLTRLASEAGLALLDFKKAA